MSAATLKIDPKASHGFWGRNKGRGNAVRGEVEPRNWDPVAMDKARWQSVVDDLTFNEPAPDPEPEDPYEFKDEPLNAPGSPTP